MSENRRFECDSGDGTALHATPTVPRDGRAWLRITGDSEEGDSLVRLSRDDARALGRRLLEIAGEEASGG